MNGADETPERTNPADRAFAKLTNVERRRVRTLAVTPQAGPGFPFNALEKAYERMLYALAAADAALSPMELVYLLAARWSSNTDGWSVQRRIALALEQGEVEFVVVDGRYRLTDEGREHLRRIERQRSQRSAQARRRPSRPRVVQRRDRRR